MRGFFFTEVERRRLRAWLEEGVESQATLNLFVDVRRNLAGLTGDVRLLVAVTRRLRSKGRLGRRGRLGSGRSSGRGGRGSTRSVRGRSIFVASSC